MKDYIIRATAANGSIRAFAADTTHLVEEARKAHGMYPVSSAALGRALTAAAMMSIDLKGEKDKLSITINGEGPLGSIVVIANSQGKVKGYAHNPFVDLSLNAEGKLDVAAAVGKNGRLTVIKDYHMKSPYVGQTELVTGEIAEDLAYYYTVSEQQPSAVGLGVLVNPDGSVKAAGGFIVQPLPDAPDEVISHIEEKLARIASVSLLIEQGKTPEEILSELLDPYDIKVNGYIEPLYQCDCSRQRLESVIISLGSEEIKDIIEEEGKAEVTCHYCNKKYAFSCSELENLLTQACASETNR
jgi:molecular chaperone Hsp33